jgi:hypothetical protein
MRVFVLLFNLGTDNEGLHTLQVGGRNLVLIFEEEDDATRYALLLEAQDFPSPAVEAIDQEEIEEFCRDANYAYQLIPKGFVPQTEADRLLLVPPERNLETTDWQAEAKPEPKDEEESMADTDLERIRRQLEGLL